MLKQFLYSLRSKHSSPMADIYENDLLKNSRSFSERVYFKKKDLYDSSVLIKFICVCLVERKKICIKKIYE